jgi:hypothetical protein
MPPSSIRQQSQLAASLAALPAGIKAIAKWQYWHRRWPENLGRLVSVMLLLLLLIWLLGKGRGLRGRRGEFEM